MLSAWGLSHTLPQSFGRQSGAVITVLTLIAASVLIAPRLAFEPASAVAENWPLVRP